MDNYNLHWFNTKEEGDDFLKKEAWNTERNNKFTEPGWYHYTWSSERSSYCSCGGCTTEISTLRPAEEYLSELRNKHRALKDDLLNNEADMMNVSDIIKSGMPV